MCGLIGIAVAGGLSQDQQLDAVDRGLQALHHRGPDVSRSWTSSDRSTTLASSRLRILDLSAAADMPLSTPSADVTLAFNGEIYNAAELRSELERNGHMFRTHSDTEVLARWLEVHWHALPQALLRVEGMFAGAGYSASRAELLLFRDRLGIKPLYYARTGEGVIFASEVRAIMRTGLLRAVVTPIGVADFLRWGHANASNAFISGIEALEPGAMLTLRRGGLLFERWWSLADAMSAQGVRMSRKKDVERFSGLVSAAVDRQLVSDRPLGIFLSGGVDSGAIAAAAAARTTNVKAITALLPGQGDDARRAAERATRLGLQHVQVPVGSEGLLDDVERCIAAMDRPSVDALNTLLVCDAAKQAGLTVVLSGLGGDELFGGYPRLRNAHLYPIFGAAAGMASGVLGSRLGNRLQRLAAEPPTVDGTYTAVRTLFSSAGLPSGLRQTCAPTGGGSGRGSKRVQALDITNYMTPRLLADTDSMSMSLSLEVRVPLLDELVLAPALAMSGHRRRWMGKRPLERLAADGRTAPKRGFDLPMDSWMRTGLKEYAREALLSEALPLGDLLDAEWREGLWTSFERREVHWTRPWTVVVLRRWLEKHQDLVPDVPVA